MFLTYSEEETSVKLSHVALCYSVSIIVSCCVLLDNALFCRTILTSSIRPKTTSSAGESARIYQAPFTETLSKTPSYISYTMKRLYIFSKDIFLFWFSSFISPVLMFFHWLSIKARVDFKVLLLTYQVLKRLSQSYISCVITITSFSTSSC